MYEAHTESKQKLTEQCMKEYEAELLKKVEKGISTNEDELMLIELKKAPSLNVQQSKRKATVIRDPLNDDYSDLPDLESDNEEVKSEKDSEKSHTKLLSPRQQFKMPEELKVMRKRLKK